MSASEGQDTRLVPAALSAWLGMGLATWGDGRIALAGLVVAAVIGVVGWRRRSFVAATIAITLAACLGIGGWRCWAVHSQPLARAATDRAVVEVTGRVASEPQRIAAGRPGPPQVVLQLTVTRSVVRRATYRSSTAVLAIGDERWLGVPVGTQVQVLGRLGPADPADSVAAVLRIRDGPVVVAGPDAWLGGIERIRQGLRDAAAPLPDAQRGLLPALVVGDTGRLDAATVAAFRTTGLTHLCAVSGSNLVILLSCALTVARVTGVRGRWLDVVGLAVVVVFVALCRAEPSVLRAAAMGLVGVAALGSGGSGRHALRTLSVAVLLLVLIDPWLARSLGFCLSVLASGGLVVWASRWTAAMRRWAPAWLAEAIAVPLAAQLATEPLTTWLSGRVSAVGLAANAVAGPLVGPATVLGIVATLLAVPALPLARVVAMLAGWCCQGIVWVAETGSRLPGASYEWPVTPTAIVLLCLICLAAMLMMEAILRRRLLVFGIAILLLVVLARPPMQPGWPPHRWSVVACDVGQGDATAVRAGAGQAIVVDTGPDPESLVRCLTTLGITRVPLLVLTHDHADHAGGLSGLVARFAPDVVLLSPLATRSRPAILAALDGRAGTVREAAPGEVIVVGAARWSTVSALRPALATRAVEGESPEENDASVVGVAEAEGVSVLLTGDLEPAGQQEALARLGGRHVDVLKVPHHGSSRQDPGLLRGWGGSVAVVSVGKGNPYGHPAAKTLRALTATGATILRTDTQGAIAIARQDGRLTATVSRP